MQIALNNYQGHVAKSATVHTNDPQRPQFNLEMKALVRPLIEVKPTNVLLFRGFVEQLKPQTIELVSNGTPFHILKTENSVPQHVAVELETVEEGKRYRLRVTNIATSGNYSGYILCRTDHPKRPELRIAVTGVIETDVSVTPLALLIGRTASDHPLRTGEIKVRNNRKAEHRISKLTYDDQLITISQEKLPDGEGYLLRVIPRLEAVPKGEHRVVTITVETDAKGGTKDQVLVNVVNQ